MAPPPEDERGKTKAQRREQGGGVERRLIFFFDEGVPDGAGEAAGKDLVPPTAEQVTGSESPGAQRGERLAVTAFPPLSQSRMLPR